MVSPPEGRRSPPAQDPPSSSVPAMSAGRLLRELEDLAADLAVDVRFEDLESAGGLCRYGGRTCLLVNQRLSVLERVALMASELASLPLGDIFIRPQLRELLESRSQG